MQKRKEHLVLPLLVRIERIPFLSCEDQQVPTIPKEQLATYHAQKAEINRYLVSRISISGFHGTIYCADTL